MPHITGSNFAIKYLAKFRTEFEIILVDYSGA
jgi:hypothetical protein